MPVNYKKELEAAARSMILVHEPDTLIRMIVRMVVRKVQVRHAGILLHNNIKDTYVLSISGGTPGLKIPKGFARMDTDNALIRFFHEPAVNQPFSDGNLVYENATQIIKKVRLAKRIKQTIKDALYQMEIFQVVACIPSYFRRELVGVLLLGEKKNGRRFGSDELGFFSALASDVAMAIKNARLFQELELELEKKRRLFIHTTVALAAAIEAKDQFTHGHTARVTNLSIEIAKKMSEKKGKAFNDKFFEDLHIASLLHDIGKIGIPEAILNKGGPLSQAEKDHIKQHPSVGMSILQPIKELQECLLGVKYHHERYDGSGYPDGLKGGEIPLIAAIISVADSFDAMTAGRPYHKELSYKDAINEIKRLSGKQFHPQAARALIKLYQENRI